VEADDRTLTLEIQPCDPERRGHIGSFTDETGRIKAAAADEGTFEKA